MYRTNLRLVAAGAALASLLALTGCGGSDDKSSDDAGSSQGTSSSDSTASSDSSDDAKGGKDGKGDKGKGSDDSSDGSSDSSDSADDSSDGSDDKTQEPVPLPNAFPTDAVPPVDGEIVSGNYSKKPLSWNVTIRDGKNVSKEYDVAEKLLTDAGCKVEIDKTGSGPSAVGQLKCDKYDVLLAVSTGSGVVVTYSVSQG
ncbi:hypothetical protein [Nocardioides panacisoli]|uniref:Uncharacterized protein n=1 Tax=Nocardioides panacisoli TaxID=627624 RepID=A0ABP7HR51_9ACTN